MTIQNINNKDALNSLLKSIHDGALQSIAEEIMAGHSATWKLIIGAVVPPELSKSNHAQLIVQDYKNQELINAVRKTDDELGVEVLVNIILCDPIIESKLEQAFTTGERFFVYGRHVDQDGNLSLVVDIRSRFFNIRTSHAITFNEAGFPQIQFEPFPLELSIDAGTLILPNDGEMPSFVRHH